MSPILIERLGLHANASDNEIGAAVASRLMNDGATARSWSGRASPGAPAAPATAASGTTEVKSQDVVYRHENARRSRAGAVR